MSDRTCPKCNYVFSFPSRLKNHFQIATHCKQTNEEIDLFFDIIKINKNNNKNNNNNININIKNKINNNIIYKCLKCNNTFLNKYTLKKHQTISKCTTLNLTDQNNSKCSALINEQNNTNQSNTQLPIINNNTTNNNTTNNNNINITNNNLTINNIIQHIYPFGFEKLPNISKDEMKKLLLSGDKGVIDIIKLVYEQEENKNFYKINMNNNNISYLNDKYKLDTCQENEMKATLYKNCISLPNDMLVICKDILTTDEILFINSNNKSISDKIKEEIYDNSLKNIINTQLRYNSKITKKNIDKYINSLITNPIIKQEAFNNIDEVISIAQKTKNEFTPSLSLTQINETLGDPILSKDLTKEITHNDFCMKKFEDTKYKKYWEKRKTDETKIVMSLTTKTLGDIIELDNRLNQIENKLNKMEYIHKDITFNNELENVEVANDYILNNNKQKYLEHTHH
jgi:hypothetical protein